MASDEKNQNKGEDIVRFPTFDADSIRVEELKPGQFLVFCDLFEFMGMATICLCEEHGIRASSYDLEENLIPHVSMDFTTQEFILVSGKRSSSLILEVSVLDSYGLVLDEYFSADEGKTLRFPMSVILSVPVDGNANSDVKTGDKNYVDGLEFTMWATLTTGDSDADTE